MRAVTPGQMADKITTEEAQHTLEVCSKSTTLREAAEKLGISYSGLRKRRESIRKFYGIRPEETIKPPAIEYPDFPEDDIPVERIIDLATERFEKRAASFAAHTWFPIKIKESLPIGICWFGDPHLDDNGCHWPELRRHVSACVNTPGLYGANVGDTTNNWAGRLAKLYAEQDASIGTARKFAEWFLLGSGVHWIAWALGNHDAWGDGSAVLAQMAKRYGTAKLVLHDWEVRFSLVFPNDYLARIYLSHDFKGSSIYNPTHGPLREGLMGEDADLYVCGHRHVSAEQGFENVARGRYQRFVRVRGFKFNDDFARRHGFKEQFIGCGAVTVFNPISGHITVHMDVDEGADYLTWLRGRAAV